MLPAILLLAFMAQSSAAIQCVINHEFTVDRYKDISMVKSTCFAARHCVAVIYRDQNPMKKQGYSVGCDKTDCNNIANETGWERRDDGHVCKKDRDYGSGGSICCCTKDFCNGASVLGLHAAAAALLIESSRLSHQSSDVAFFLTSPDLWSPYVRKDHMPELPPIHDRWLEVYSKVITMTTNQLCAGFKFCVYAVYEDVDPMRKQGFTMGCDKNDCGESHRWDLDEHGRRCKNDSDYGSEGFICCCETNLCNDFPPRRVRWDNIVPCFVVLFVIVLLLSAIMFCLGRVKKGRNTAQTPNLPTEEADGDHDLIDLNDIE